MIDADLTRQVQALTETLQDVPLADCGPALEDFVREGWRRCDIGSTRMASSCSPMCSLQAKRSQRTLQPQTETEATIAVTTAEQATLTARCFFLIRRAPTRSM